ncbi:outer membrane protein assembly factor BamE [Sphingomicrobium astaxanthinifaciens]|uniref:outer membrane protein assembly factor BamE n=1 Tax=Sphingomicrobium astaxanthinifaciens TaxID=1227949 RepID=UPI001FCBCB0A|nr:outer membrane protein assembly factor BamE [Sphingomicrobium astaxanthinifaciens]MCJ7421127.1 outer membrane protein assembly factor BamE [Sphingomicrobium astaxanthinifaciens]
MRASHFLALSVATALLGGCAGIRSDQGYVYNQELTEAIAPGVDNRDSVKATLGTPSFVGQFDDKDWYYVSRRTDRFAFRQPRLTDQRVIRVRFDEFGNVAEVVETGPELAVAIDPSNDETPTLGREKSFFEELFGNIGSVNQMGGIAGPPQQ